MGQETLLGQYIKYALELGRENRGDEVESLGAFRRMNKDNK